MIQPSISEIQSYILTAMADRYGFTLPKSKRRYFGILSYALAVTFALIYKLGGFNRDQMFADKCQDGGVDLNGKTINPLSALGELLGVFDDRSYATKTEITIFIDTVPDTVIEAGRIFTNANGVEYEATRTVDVLSYGEDGYIVIPARSVLAGAVTGAISTGDPMTSENFPASVSQMYVQSIVQYGRDVESRDEYRQRVIEKFRRSPQGTSYYDAVRWVRGVPSIAEAWAGSADEPGIIGVYALSDPDAAADEYGGLTSTQQILGSRAGRLDEGGFARREPLVLSGFGVASPDVLDFNYVLQFDLISAPDETARAKFISDVKNLATEYINTRRPYFAAQMDEYRAEVSKAELDAQVYQVFLSYGGAATVGPYATLMYDGGGEPTTGVTLGGGEYAALQDFGVTFV